MFRRKKKEEAVEPTPEPQAPVEEPGSTPVEEAAASAPTIAEDSAAEAAPAAESVSLTASAEATSVVSSPTAKGRGHRVQKVGTVSSDKMQKTVVVRVDRLVLHPKYRRYVRPTTIWALPRATACASLKRDRCRQGSAGAWWRLCRRRRNEFRNAECGFRI